MRYLKYYFLFILILKIKLIAHDDYGYISYTSFNIGDDIQAIAAKQFLPSDSISVDREFIGVFSHPQSVNTIVNGFFMHTKKDWYRNDIPPPQKSWPPSSCINPLFISIHLTKSFLSEALSKEGIEYLKAFSPIGARDYFTLKQLKNNNIPSYFSGCLTLTLNNEIKNREDVIYAVDIDKECLEYLRSKTKTSIIVELTHIINPQQSLDYEFREKYTQEILAKYKSAKCVITTRLHASMPCLAFETPVLLLNTQADQYRFNGLKNLVHNCSRQQFLDGEVDFNFDDPPENPKKYLSLRKNLIQVVKNWVNNGT